MEYIYNDHIVKIDRGAHYTTLRIYSLNEGYRKLEYENLHLPTLKNRILAENNACRIADQVIDWSLITC